MKAQIVSFHCTLKNKLGNVISSTFNQDVITHLEGEQGEMLRGLAEGLRDLKQGEKRSIALAADQAYGFYDPALVIQVSRKRVSDGHRVQAGHQIQGRLVDRELRTYRVIHASGDLITLDANHPLAGQDLVFDIEATHVREATPEEITESILEASEKILH